MNAFGWGMRHPLAMLFCALAVCPGGVALLAQPADARTVSPAEVGDAAAYWTAARMERARPVDLRVPGPRGVVSEAGGVPPGASLSAVRPPLAAQGGALASSATETVVDPTGPVARRHGVIFFETLFGLGRCSGTSVNAPSYSLVVTAAHCVNSGGPYGFWFDSSWVFVPGYRHGQRPFGVFPAKWIDTTRRWRTAAGENYDVGVAVVARNASGELLGKAVGGTGIAWGLKPRQVFDIHGYPAAPPFDGKTQQTCSGTPYLGHDARSFLLPGPLNLAAECRLTGGASGGGWTIERGILNSVTSYGYPSDPATNFGPYFGDEVARLVTRAGKVK